MFYEKLPKANLTGAFCYPLVLFWRFVSGQSFIEGSKYQNNEEYCDSYPTSFHNILIIFIIYNLLQMHKTSYLRYGNIESVHLIKRLSTFAMHVSNDSFHTHVAILFAVAGA